MAHISEGTLKQLKTLTLLEAAEVIKQYQEAVSAAVSLSEGVEEKMAFDVILDDVPADKKIAVLKIVRELTDLDLMAAKDLVGSTPRQIKEGISKEDAEIIRTKLEEAGAKAHIAGLKSEKITVDFSDKLPSLNDNDLVPQEINDILVELASIDHHISKNQADIDSLKIETREMLETLAASVGLT